jgi:23S rRNA (uracil1939-C5)-methyltransferase
MGRKEKEFILRIDSLAVGGEGIGRRDGLVVFVSGAAPGDLVKVRPYKRKRGYLKAKVTEILEASEDRIEPTCKYFGLCGGCQWLHLRYDSQLKYKVSHVKETLRGIGGIAEIPLEEIIPSPKTLRYRNKMEFTFAPHDHDWCVLGLHKKESYWQIIDVEDCLLMPEYGIKILGVARDITKGYRLRPYHIKAHEGLMRFLMLRYSFSMDNWLVNLITSTESNEINFFKEITAQISHMATLVNNINPNLASTAIGEKEVLLYGKGVIYETIGNYKFEVRPNSFFQVNSLCACMLYKEIENVCSLDGSEEVIDAYCGIGAIGIYLSDKAKNVIGIEISEANIDAAKMNVKNNAISNMKLILGKTEDILKDVLKPHSLLIIDPPRSGLHKNVIKTVLEIKPRKLVYVSCNPATLSRDVGILAQCYRLTHVRPVDMFPQTAHIEAVAGLERRYS